MSPELRHQSMPPIEKKKKFLFLFLNQSSALALRSSQSESIEYSRRKIKKSMRLVCVWRCWLRQHFHRSIADEAFCSTDTFRGCGHSVTTAPWRWLLYRPGLTQQAGLVPRRPIRGAGSGGAPAHFMELLEMGSFVRSCAV